MLRGSICKAGEHTYTQLMFSSCFVTGPSPTARAELGSCTKNLLSFRLFEVEEGGKELKGRVRSVLEGLSYGFVIESWQEFVT